MIIFFVSDRRIYQTVKTQKFRGENPKNSGVRIEAIKYACPNPNCKSVFNDKSNRNRHVNHQCGKPPRFKCSHCSYRSHHKAHIKTHARNKHTDVETYVIELYNPCSRRRKYSYI